MRKSKRIICIMLAALTIISAPLTSYMEAQAGELILELSLLDQLLIMFGINAGLGEQYDYFKRQDQLKGLFEAAAEGGTAELSGYGTVNFSETQSLKEWFEWSLNCQKFLLGNLSVINPENAARYMEVGKALDEVSYKNSGTCATNALNDNISDVYEEYKADPQKVLEEIQEAAKIICSPDTEITDISDAEARAEFNRKFWGTFCAVAAAGMLGVGNTAVPYAALKMYSISEFNEYDFSTVADGFSGSLPKYSVSIDPAFETYKSYYVLCTRESQYGTSIDDEYYLVSESNYCGIYDGNNIRFYSYFSGKLSSVYVSGRSIHNNGAKVTTSNVSSFNKSEVNSFYAPLFSSSENAINYFKTGDTSGILNISNDDVYRRFKQNTGTAGAVIGNPLSGYVGSLKSLANLIDIIPAVREASDTYGGTSEMLPEIARILSEAGDIAIGSPDADDPNKSSNYSGILAKILAAINRLPAAILSALAGKFMTAERLETLLNGIPVILAGVLSDAFSDSQISILPGILSDALSAAFPDAASAIKALIDLPAYIVSAVSGIQVKVPEITIPDIVIPEIAIPDIVIPEIVIPDIAVPDVFVEAPAVTLNPTFDITVANDYAGLGDVISDSINGVMAEVFVPDKTLALERIDDMKEYFEFADELKTKIGFFAEDVAGIEPCPYLRIPLGKVKDSRYSYGFGDYWVIDCTWYIPYKDFGDKIILCLFWAVFFWQLFIKLPGIISGVSGSVDGAYSSWYRYLDTKGPARIEGKKG